MNAIILLLASTTLGGDVGWQPLAGGGFEYIIQIAPDELETLKAGQDIVNEIPPELAGVKRYRITVGTGPVPRIGTPPEVASGQFNPPAATSTATNSAHDPFASSRNTGASAPGGDVDEEFVNRVQERLNGGTGQDTANAGTPETAAGTTTDANVPQMSEHNPFRETGPAQDRYGNIPGSAAQDRYASNPGSATQDRYAANPNYLENSSRFSAGSTAGQDLNPQTPPDGQAAGAASQSINDVQDNVAPGEASIDHGFLPFGEYLLPIDSTPEAGVDPFAASGYGENTTSENTTSAGDRYSDRLNNDNSQFGNFGGAGNFGNREETDNSGQSNNSSGRLKLSDVGASDPFAKKANQNARGESETPPPTLNPDNATRLANYRSDEEGPSGSGKQGKSKSAATEPAEQPGWMWTIVVLAMFASLGTNGWLALLLRDSRRKYADLLERYQHGEEEEYEEDVHYEAA